MQVRLLCILLVALVPSCFLARPYKQSSFSYTTDNGQATVPLLVPRGFVKMEKQDTAGVTLQTFYYPGGAMLYAAYLEDTSLRLQPFNDRVHQPQVLGEYGLAYKGLDENELYYREIRRGHLRFGYRKVPDGAELSFDSATNYAFWHGRTAK